MSTAGANPGSCILLATWPDDAAEHVQKLCAASANVRCVGHATVLETWTHSMRTLIKDTSTSARHIVVVGIDGGTFASEQSRAMPSLLQQVRDEIHSDKSIHVVLRWLFYFELADFEQDLDYSQVAQTFELRNDGLIVVASIPAYTYEYVHAVSYAERSLDYVHGFAGQTIAHGSFFKEWQGMVRGYIEGKVRQSDQNITVLGIEGGPCSMEEADLMPQLLRNIRHNLKTLGHEQPRLSQDQFRLDVRWRYYLDVHDFKEDIGVWLNSKTSKTPGAFGIEDSSSHVVLKTRLRCRMQSGIVKCIVLLVVYVIGAIIIFRSMPELPNPSEVVDRKIPTINNLTSYPFTFFVSNQGCDVCANVPTARDCRSIAEQLSMDYFYENDNNTATGCYIEDLETEKVDSFNADRRGPKKGLSKATHFICLQPSFKEQVDTESCGKTTFRNLWYDPPSCNRRTQGFGLLWPNGCFLSYNCTKECICGHNSSAMIDGTKLICWKFQTARAEGSNKMHI